MIKDQPQVGFFHFFLTHTVLEYNLCKPEKKTGIKRKVRKN